MTSRRKRPHRLADAPLVVVLSEVKFAPILTMDVSIPSIQDHLRRQGFPVFERHATHEIRISADEAPKFTALPRWVFGNKERDNFVVITESSVALETTNYSIFEEFTEGLETALDVVQKEVQPAFTERVGLRYINSIEPKVEQTINYYLRPSMRGLSPEQLGVESLLWRVETAGEIPNVGEIRVRLHQTQSNSRLPPDVVAPELGETGSDGDGVKTTLDIDCSAKEQTDFGSELLISKFWQLHNYTDKAFRAAVTPEALREWGDIDE